MEITWLQENEVEGTLANEAEQFTVGDASAMIALVIRLYGKPIQTSIQEYMSNARDAMREARAAGLSPKPIEVDVPSPLNCTLRIRDYGLGIGPQRMNDIFLRMEVSTKRNDKGPYWNFDKEDDQEVDYCPRCGERDCIDCEDSDDDY